MPDQDRQEGIVRVAEQAYLLLVDAPPIVRTIERTQAVANLLVALDSLCWLARHQGDKAVYEAIAAVSERADGGPLQLLAAQAIKELAEAGWAFDSKRIPGAFEDDDEDEVE
jgi:hypothetical protein